MNRQTVSNAAMQHRHGDAPTPFIQFLQTLSLLLLVAVVALRPLVHETYDSEGNSISRAVTELADPSPARTLGFDLVVLTAACLWLISFALRRAVKYRWTGLEVGLCVLAVAGGVSCYFAGNKRLAINGTVDWLCYPILAIALTQLLDCGWRRTLVLSAILASAAVNAAQCHEQYFVGFDETIQQYETDKKAFWAQQGVELDSPTVDAFERRLRAREASGFFAHSNVAGAYLMLCGFAGLGMIARHLRLRWALIAQPALVLSFVLAMAAMLGIAVAVFLSGSTGAMLAGALGMVLFLIKITCNQWIGSHRRRLFWISWCASLMGVAAVVRHGWYHDSLPGWSLTFRWQYWKASAAMVADHFWTGVGRENFGRHYTLYKDIASPEEVSNPHNFLVQATAEWGVLGLVAILTMLVGVTWLASRPAAPRSEPQASETSIARFPVLAILGLGAVVGLGKAALLSSDDANYLYYSTVTTALVWLPVCLVFAKCCIEPWPSGGLLSVSLAAGLLAFLLQDLISFALYVPASATTYFALLGVWLSLRPWTNSNPEVRVRWIISAVACGMTLGFVAAVFFPVSQCAHWLDQARSRATVSYTGEDPRIAAYRAAAVADRLDPTPWVEMARLGSRAQPEVALDATAQAILRDPRNKSLYRQQSRLYLLAAAKSGTPDQSPQAIVSARTALSLYPADPSGLVFLADTEQAVGQATNSKELLSDALGHYREALALDAKRLPWETIRRLHPRQLDEIRRNIADLEERLRTLP